MSFPIILSVIGMTKAVRIIRKGNEKFLDPVMRFRGLPRSIYRAQKRALTQRDGWLVGGKREAERAARRSGRQLPPDFPILHDLRRHFSAFKKKATRAIAKALS